MNIPTLVTNKPDAETAEEFKRQLAEAYKPLLSLLDEITTKGFVAQIATGPDAFGKQSITQLLILKKY